MDQDTGVTDWIAAYLGWAESDYRAIPQPPPCEPALATSEEIAAAYLEWLDATPANTSRETILLTALRRALREYEVEQRWPQALEAVAADVRALKGEVMAMRLH